MKRLVALIGIITAIATILIVVELTGRLPKDLYNVLFDWIVGTATLAAVAVALFFGIKSLLITGAAPRTNMNNLLPSLLKLVSKVGIVRQRE